VQFSSFTPSIFPPEQGGRGKNRTKWGKKESKGMTGGTSFSPWARQRDDKRHKEERKSPQRPRKKYDIQERPAFYSKKETPNAGTLDVAYLGLIRGEKEALVSTHTKEKKASGKGEEAGGTGLWHLSLLSRIPRARKRRKGGGANRHSYSSKVRRALGGREKREKKIEERKSETGQRSISGQ